MWGISKLPSVNINDHILMNYFLKLELIFDLFAPAKTQNISIWGKLGLKYWTNEHNLHKSIS